MPDFLVELEPDQPELLGDGDERGCKFCGGLGHRITDCPKLESAQRVKANERKDYLASGTQDYWKTAPYYCCYTKDKNLWSKKP